MKIEPYLFFNGRCEEAIEFYRQAVGAKVEALIRFKESPEPPNADCPVPPGWDDKVMHGSFRIGETLVMASDGHGGAPAEFRRILEHSASQARGHRDVVARFGRHPHRNAILGRESTADERDHLASGQLVHTRSIPR